MLAGTLYTAFYEAAPDAEFTGVTVEFGTGSLETVFTALRGEQWLHLHPDAPPPLRTALKRMLRDAFCVESNAWKAVVVAGTRDAVTAAVRGLGSVQR